MIKVHQTVWTSSSSASPQRTLRYWLSFSEGLCEELSKPPGVIVLDQPPIRQKERYKRFQKNRWIIPFKPVKRHGAELGWITALTMVPISEMFRNLNVPPKGLDHRPWPEVTFMPDKRAHKTQKASSKEMLGKRNQVLSECSQRFTQHTSTGKHIKPLKDILPRILFIKKLKNEHVNGKEASVPMGAFLRMQIAAVGALWCGLGLWWWGNIKFLVPNQLFLFYF